MRCAALMLLTLVASLCASVAQVKLRLGVADSIPVGSQRPSGVIVPAKCDEEGNIYARFIRGLRPLAAPISRISPDASKRVVFDLLALPEKHGWTITDFSPGDHGSLYELAQDQRGAPYVVRFSANGEFERTIELKVKDSVALWHLVALPNETFFVVGIHLADKSHRRSVEAFNGIFDSSGDLVKEVHVSGHRVGHSQVNSAGDLVPGNDISLGSALVDDRGNVYVLKHSLPVEVYVISTSGQLLRMFKVKSPLDKAGPGAAQVNNGHLAVEFSRPTRGNDPDETIFRVVDTSTGALFADYELTPGAWGSFACYMPDGFVFVSADKGIQTLLHVVPQ